MTFGAYPHKQEVPRMSFEQPLLDESRTSEEDVEYEKSSHFATRGGNWRRRLHRSCLFTLLQGIVLTAFVLQSVVLWRIWRRSSYTEALGELNGLVPSVGTETVLFAPNPEFDPLNASDPEWDRVMPLGGGFVPIDNWQGKSLPSPILSRGKTLYNVAVFHQLHCLHMVAEEFNNLMVNGNLGSAHNHGKRDGHEHHSHASASNEDGQGDDKNDAKLEHIRHCFEYIKSSLTCCADTALEGQKSDSDLPSTDGAGSYHTCRKFDDVFNWAEMNSPSTRSGYPHNSD